MKLFSSKPLYPQKPKPAGPDRKAVSPRETPPRRSVPPQPRPAPAKRRPAPVQAPPAVGKKRRTKRQKRLRRLIAAVLILALLTGTYFFLMYTKLPFVAKWRTAYIETAMATMTHQWLAEAFIPRGVIDEVMENLERERQNQIGLTSRWDAAGEETEKDDPWNGPGNRTLRDTRGMSKAEIAFYNYFWEIDVPSMQAYLEEHPSALRSGWQNLSISEAGRDGDGTDIRTVFGEQVLAVNAREGVLVLRVKGAAYRGVLAVAKDPSRLSLRPSAHLGSMGQRAGEIAKQHRGLLAMTGSGFQDYGGVGNGGSVVGWCMCDGKPAGEHMPVGYKRIELHRDDRFYICDAHDPVSPDVTDAVEFSPAMIVDGKVVIKPNSGWTDLQPRACIGQSQYGEILMLLVEGRLPAVSIGISVEDCAEILYRHDCAQAMNLDGGTSAMIWYDGEYIMKCSNPQLPEGRTLPNAFVYARK